MVNETGPRTTRKMKIEKKKPELTFDWRIFEFKAAIMENLFLIFINLAASSLS